MHVLGISCGTANGNSEILLKMALEEIISQRPSTTYSILRISTVSIPPFDPCDPWSQDVNSKIPDDRPAALDAILEADAIIVASPIWTRQPAGHLKNFCDRALGPRVDYAMVMKAVEGGAAPNSDLSKVKFDERVLKPRVAALIAVGGADGDEWGTLALPGLHQSVFSLHAKVVDQMIVYGCPIPGAILFNEKKELHEAREKAKKLGKNIASQMGKSFDDAEYLGDIRGACPICHLNVVELNGKEGGATCGTCGAKGKLVMREGLTTLDLANQTSVSVLTLEGKMRHVDELRAIGSYFGPRQASWQAEQEKWKQLDSHVLKMSKL